MDLLLVNFGGPRNGAEIEPFLRELLQDRDVVWTRFPDLLHKWFFARVAKRRALRIKADYDKIGGKSPIYFDTETIACELRKKLPCNVLTFHRYLPDTHRESLEKIEAAQTGSIKVFPLFPQFCYATTGSIARFFSKNLSANALEKLCWLPSYAVHPLFVQAYEKTISAFLKQKGLTEDNTALLFSAHGVPLAFSLAKDPYQSECEQSYEAIRAAFPSALCRLSYQSKFGRGEWIRPSTEETCREAMSWMQDRKHVVVVPLTFTSDHIETLFEIEEQYLPLLQEQGLRAYRCPALNLEPHWMEALAELSQTSSCVRNEALIRTKNQRGR